MNSEGSQLYTDMNPFSMNPALTTCYSYHLLDVPLKFLRICHFFSEIKVMDVTICLALLDEIMYAKALGYMQNIVQM